MTSSSVSVRDETTKQSIQRKVSSSFPTEIHKKNTVTYLDGYDTNDGLRIEGEVSAQYEIVSTIDTVCICEPWTAIQAKCELNLPIDTVIDINIQTRALQIQKSTNALVKKNMIHRCWDKGPNPCIVNGKCRYDYPFICQDASIVTHTSYPTYRRPSDKDKCIVAHNRYILYMWQGHSCIYSSNSTQSLIYLYEYLYKGAKRAKLDYIPEDTIKKEDEILQYIRGRKLCAMEVMWHIFGYQMYPHSNPSIKVIKVIAEDVLDVRLENNEIPKLHQYFCRHNDLKDLKFTEYFTDYTLTTQNKKNVTLKSKIKLANGKTYYDKKVDHPEKHFCRIERVHYSSGELFFLRIILLNRPVVSYEDALICNDTKYSTFQDSCEHHGYIDRNEIGYTIFKDSILDTTFTGLRILFVVLALEGYTVASIWNDLLCRDKMRDDKDQNKIDDIKDNNTLLNLKYKFQMSGKDLTDYGLPDAKNVKTEMDRYHLYYNKVNI
jgi:hypothetical protein